jgi:hypothetical protein
MLGPANGSPGNRTNTIGANQEIAPDGFTIRQSDCRVL